MVVWEPVWGHPLTFFLFFILNLRDIPGGFFLGLSIVDITNTYSNL